VIWGFLSIPLRSLTAFSAGEILYFRIAFSLVVLILIIALFRKQSLRNDLRLLLSFAPARRWGIISLTLIGGALLTVNWLTFIYIVNHINVKTASFSYLICPVITAVLGYLMLAERMTRVQWIAVLLCALSCVL